MLKYAVPFLGSLYSLFAFFTTLTVLKTESVMSKLSPSDVKSIAAISFHSEPVNTPEWELLVLSSPSNSPYEIQDNFLEEDSACSTLMHILYHL